MKNLVTPFYYSSEYNRVTTIRTMKDSEDKVWFCAKDICDILEIKNVTQALESLDEDELSMFNIGNLSPKGGNPNINFVNESGLYALIFKSKKPEARKFRKWVTNEVLPAIKKTGSYSFVTEESEYEQPTVASISRGKVRAAKMILEAAGLTTGQELSMKLDKVYKHYTGDSILEITGLLDEWEAERLRECKRLSLPPEGWEPDCMNISTF